MIQKGLVSPITQAIRTALGTQIKSIFDQSKYVVLTDENGVIWVDDNNRIWIEEK